MILALSLAWARLKAKSENLELFKYINKLLNAHYPIPITNFPRPIFNVIEGGVHAQNALNFQEFQIIPEISDFGIAYGLGQEFYRKLREFLEQEFGKENVLLGDEAGFSCPFKNNEEAIEILTELIRKYNYPLRIGLDAAASQFFHAVDKRGYQADSRGYYLVDGKKYSAEELKDFYLGLIKNYNLLSIEDPFNEKAFDIFAELTQNLAQNRRETLIVTDDLTTTNSERLKIAIEKKSGNTILIKPNQIGTLTETLKVVKLAYENNWETIVSHRSGETMDDFIADLAAGIGAWGIKAGAPVTSERLSKYERLLEISN